MQLNPTFSTGKPSFLAGCLGGRHLSFAIVPYFPNPIFLPRFPCLFEASSFRVYWVMVNLGSWANTSRSGGNNRSSRLLFILLLMYRLFMVWFSLKVPGTAQLILQYLFVRLFSLDRLTQMFHLEHSDNFSSGWYLTIPRTKPQTVSS